MDLELMSMSHCRKLDAHRMRLRKQQVLRNLQICGLDAIEIKPDNGIQPDKEVHTTLNKYEGDNVSLDSQSDSGVQYIYESDFAKNKRKQIEFPAPVTVSKRSSPTALGVTKAEGATPKVPSSSLNRATQTRESILSRIKDLMCYKTVDDDDIAKSPVKEGTLSLYKRFRSLSSPKVIVSPRKFGIHKSPRGTSSDKIHRASRQARLYNKHNVDSIYSPKATKNKESAGSLRSIVDKIHHFSWEVTLNGLQDLLHIGPGINWKNQEREICLIYRKLLECSGSLRSSVTRVACQVSGEMFKMAKSSRRPEYDDLVEMLLCKTSDTNRFIQHDANVALDKMITNIPEVNVIRAICMRGPDHKNPLVRATVARLIICMCAMNGVDFVLGSSANYQTRKRVFGSIVKFLTDKNVDTRKYGERICTIMMTQPHFQDLFFGNMDQTTKVNMKKILNRIQHRSSSAGR